MGVYHIRMQKSNICMICIVALILSFMAVKYSVIMKRAVRILAFSAVIMFILNVIMLKNQIDGISSIQANNADNGNAANEKILTLSKNGNNVIVVMLDRGINGYIPFIFDEKPELEQAFEGFTYYPNTLSFCGFTNFGVPALFGGYEYTPVELNKRKDEKQCL